jgi:hypothetical protein
VLLVGRLLGGIATSLLFSAFEAWAVAAHNNSGYPESLLGDLFTKVGKSAGASWHWVCILQDVDGLVIDQG